MITSIFLSRRVEVAVIPWIIDDDNKNDDEDRITSMFLSRKNDLRFDPTAFLS